MNDDEILARKKTALAAALMQPHPELLTLITSDKGSAEIADAINDLIEFHCLKVRMGSRMTHPTLGLLPCPFCGGEAYLDRTNPGMDIDTSAWYCGCRACGYSLASFRISNWTQGKGWKDDPDAKQKAIGLWNKRA